MGALKHSRGISSKHFKTSASASEASEASAEREKELLSPPLPLCAGGQVNSLWTGY